jgi:hypothetical protein
MISVGWTTIQCGNRSNLIALSSLCTSDVGFVDFQSILDDLGASLVTG